MSNTSSDSQTVSSGCLSKSQRGVSFVWKAYMAHHCMLWFVKSSDSTVHSAEKQTRTTSHVVFTELCTQLLQFKNSPCPHPWTHAQPPHIHTYSFFCKNLNQNPVWLQLNYFVGAFSGIVYFGCLPSSIWCTYAYLNCVLMHSKDDAKTRLFRLLIWLEMCKSTNKILCFFQHT